MVTALLVSGVELAVVGLLLASVYTLALLVVFRPAGRASGAVASWGKAFRVKTRNFLIFLSVVGTMGLLAFNGWLVWRGVDARQHTTNLVSSITADTWWAAAIIVGKVLLAIVAALVVTRVLRRAARAAESSINRWDQLKDNNKSLSVLFRGFDRTIGNIGWLLVAIFTCGLVGAPQNVTDGVVLLLRIYIVFTIGLTVVRSTSVVVDTLDGFSRRYATSRGWLEYYDRVRPLLPTLRACLEYALWVGLASLIVVQLEPIRNFAVWGPRAIQAIAIFFAGRVVVELGCMELSRRMLPSEGLDQTERRRRATIVPLLLTAFTYAVYFGTGVLMLDALGRDPMPFLAGLGVLTLVIGFGAQALINDVVSGFFILFENTYLMGETIEVGGAKGEVEAIEFRTTKIRDDAGRLHIIRNGDMKPVINYSREFTIAVVDVVVGYDADLRAVFAALRRACDTVRAESPHVQAETVIEGVVSFSRTRMVVRTLTRVTANSQDIVSAAIRLAIKEEFDSYGSGMSRRMLVPPARHNATMPSGGPIPARTRPQAVVID